MLNTSICAAKQERLDSNEHHRPPDEVVAQRKAEIARRYAWDDRQRAKLRANNIIANLRMRELERVFADRYGTTLPDDDAGRDDLFVVFHHIVQVALRPDLAMRAWASMWAPWIVEDELTALIVSVTSKPLRWGADKLGWRLGVNDAKRVQLDLRTIAGFDVGKAARIARRKKRDKDEKARKRRAAGARSRKQSLSQTEPWKKLGMSRAKWFRLGKPDKADLPEVRRDEADETVSSAIDEDTSLRTKRSHHSAPSVPARCRAAVAPQTRTECSALRARLHL